MRFRIPSKGARLRKGPRSHRRPRRHRTLAVQWLERRILLAAVPFSDVQVISDAVSGARSIDIADLDRDGDLDIVSAAFDSDTIAWHANQGDGSYTAPQVIDDAADGARAVHAADLDRDGDLDVIGASANNDTIAWYENDSAGNFGLPQPISTSVDGATSVDVADVDSDGDVDIVSSALNSGTIAWHENLGGPGAPGFAPQQVISATATGPWSVLVADPDRDGDVDVLAALSGDASIVWYENESNHYSAIFELDQMRSISSDVIGNWIPIHAADLDGDGDMDVLTASSADAKIAWYANDGAGGFGPQQIISTIADFVRSVHAVDLDGDGDMDVLSASQFDDKIAWYANDGTGGFGTQQVITTSADGAFSDFAADLDVDGDIDDLPPQTKTTRSRGSRTMAMAGSGRCK